MCYLVTVGTRESYASVKALVARPSRLAVRQSSNSSLRAVFPQQDHLFELTSGHCSCDLVIHRTERSLDAERTRLRAQYERKGWSQARAARAVRDWNVAHQRRLEKQAVPRRHFYALLHALALKPGGVRVVIHDYSGQFDTEDVQVVEVATVPADRLGEAGVLGEDRVTNIVPGPVGVRFEHPADVVAVREVNEQAFGGSLEAGIVDALRGSTGALSLVATVDDRVVGHILFTPVTLEPPADNLRVAGLGPMAVRPEVQRRGVGGQLVRAGLEACRGHGYTVVVVVGHPQYYPRFGFVPAHEKRLRYEPAVPREAFMVVELDAGALSGRAYVVRYRPEFAVE